MSVSTSQTEEDDHFEPASTCVALRHPIPDHNDNPANASRLSYRPSQLRRVSALCFVGNTKTIPDCDRLILSIKNCYPHVAIYYSDTGKDDFLRGVHDLAFVVTDFNTPTFNYIKATTASIFGPTAIAEYISAKEDLRVPRRPLFCRSMRNVTCVTSGLADRREITKLVDLIHNMGGSVREKINGASITHLVSRTTQSEKYRMAVSLGIKVMAETWIAECWEKRHTPNVSALAEPLMSRNRLLPFYLLKLCFHGFDEEETEEMKSLTTTYGGQVVEADSSLITHQVVSRDVAIEDIMSIDSEEVKVVTGEWFWVSIQLDLCANESLYLATDRKRVLLEPTSRSRHPRTLDKTVKSSSSTSGLDRDINNTPPSKPPRRSHQLKRLGFLTRSTTNTAGVVDAKAMADSCPHLDRSADISITEGLYSMEELDLAVSTYDVDPSPKQKQQSKRQQVCYEMYQTEHNYVNVLQTILDVFNKPLELQEQKVEKEGGELLLSKSERLTIFGKIEPILSAHKIISSQLYALINHWSDDHKIGQIWTASAKKLIECYPPFVNSFEQAKETLVDNDNKNPKFHAFLKACQSRSECQRQSLQELLIRPVQRLPSVTLLLNDLLKRTKPEHRDHQYLQRAIDSVKEVLQQVNERKRQTEDQFKLMSVFRDIENCPPDLFSSHRELLGQLDAIDVEGRFHQSKGQALTFYLFNDTIVMTKQRDRTRNRTGSQSVSTPGGGTPTTGTGHVKTHKYLTHETLGSVRCVYDVHGCEDSDMIFILKMRTEIDDRISGFVADGCTTTEKRRFLLTLCRQVQEQTGRTDCPVCDIDSTNPKVDEELASIVQKAGRYGGANVTGTPGMLQRTLSFGTSRKKGIRRAISTMSVGFNNTLSRMSRSQLPRMQHPPLQNLFETDENTPPAGGSAMNQTEAGDVFFPAHKTDFSSSMHFTPSRQSLSGNERRKSFGLGFRRQSSTLSAANASLLGTKPKTLTRQTNI